MKRIALTPVQERKIVLTPVVELSPVGAADQPFARIKREYPDFKALRDAFATFAELKAAN
ncbi:MAG TPA: hypothetical protein VK488_05375 [Gaiellaceae bacterium]|nr:hypothetical protein [Gaiellaceae bacterium]